MKPRDAAPCSGVRGRLVVLSGPSGVGKSAVVDRVLRDPRFGRAITATTRAPRPGERDGVDYHFLDVDTFRARLGQGWFLEHAEVYAQLYGTPRSSVDAVLASGRHCILVIDVQGADTLRREAPDSIFVFLEAPDRRELERRLRSRGGDDPTSVDRRLDACERELREADRFAHRLVNLDVDATARAVAALVGVVL
jgi:guanylate kinase